jgi:hypothetical protein
MQEQSRVGIVGIFVKMIDSPRVKSARAPDNPVNLIALPKKELRQIRSILPCNTCNNRFPHFSPAQPLDLSRLRPFEPHRSLVKTLAAANNTGSLC